LICSLFLASIPFFHGQTFFAAIPYDLNATPFPAFDTLAHIRLRFVETYYIHLNYLT